MGLFSDDFERSNGAAGNGWTDLNGTLTITSGAVGYSGVVGYTYNTNTYDANRHDATIHASGNGTSGQRAGVIVRAGSGNHGFTLCITGTTRPYTLAIFGSAALSGSPIASASLDVNLPPMYSLRLTWEAGHLVGYYNGTQMLTVDSALYFNDRYAGLICYTTTAPIQDFTCVAGSALALSVSPSVIPNYGGACSTVTLTGTGTAWTPGTPGSPTFTVDHGTLSDQTVVDDHTATATYCPGDWLGAILFTDPSTSQTAGAVVTSDPGIINPAGLALSQTAIDYIERSAVAETNPTIANRDMSVVATHETMSMLNLMTRTLDTSYALVGETPGANLASSLLYVIWGILNGRTAEEEGNTVLGNAFVAADRSDTILDRMSFAKTDGSYDAGTLMREIAGLPGGSIQDVLDAIAALEAGSTDLTPVLDALAAIRGDTTTSLYTLLTSLAAIRTVNAWSLGSVKDWIDAIPAPTPVDLTAITDKLAAIQPSTSYTMSSIAGQSSSLLTNVGGLTDAFSALTSDGEISLAVITAALDAITALLNALGKGSPVWTSAEEETLGEEFTLVDGLDLEGPMDGVILTITAHPPGAGVFGFGDMRSWGHAGAVAFRNDLDAYEWPISLGPQKQVITPRSMRSAAGARVRLGNGFHGTVRTFSASGG